MSSWTRVVRPDRQRESDPFLNKTITPVRRGPSISRLTMKQPKGLSTVTNFLLEELEYQKSLQDLSVSGVRESYAFLVLTWWLGVVLDC